MIYYPLAIVMLAGMRENFTITAPHDHEQFLRLLVMVANGVFIWNTKSSPAQMISHKPLSSPKNSSTARSQRWYWVTTSSLAMASSRNSRLLMRNRMAQLFMDTMCRILSFMALRHSMSMTGSNGLLKSPSHCHLTMRLQGHIL